eukprot:gene9105-10078_t
MDGGSIRFIDAHSVEKHLNLEELILKLEKGFANFSSKNSDVVQPVRSAVEVKEHSGFLLTMPAYSASDNALATKLVTLYSNNDALGLPSHQGIIVSFDAATGTPNAILDAESITNLRTAAATAVATKHLAAKDANILAIIGAGHQARSHIQLLSLVRNFSEVRICSRTYERAEQLANEVNGKAFKNVEEAVKDADVIVTVTLSKDPVVFGKWTKKDCLINIVGACRPNWRETDDDIMQSSEIVVDTIQGANKESGDIILSKAKILCEIGQVISGDVKVDMQKRRVFKSLVHKEPITAIPNALPDKGDPEIEIYGMEGIPDKDMKEREQMLKRKKVDDDGKNSDDDDNDNNKKPRIDQMQPGVMPIPGVPLMPGMMAPFPGMPGMPPMAMPGMPMFPGMPPVLPPGSMASPMMPGVPPGMLPNSSVINRNPDIIRSSLAVPPMPRPLFPSAAPQASTSTATSSGPVGADFKPLHGSTSSDSTQLQQGAKPSTTSAVNNITSSSKPGTTVPLVSATSRIVHPEEDISLEELRSERPKYKTELAMPIESSSGESSMPKPIHPPPSLMPGMQMPNVMQSFQQPTTSTTGFTSPHFSRPPTQLVNSSQTAYNGPAIQRF